MSASQPENIGPGASLGRDAWLAHIRHELRTPINVIIGFSEMLLEDGRLIVASSEGRQDLEHVLDAGKRALAEIDALLNPEKIERARDLSIENLTQKIQVVLRTPINTVTGYTEMLIESVSEKEPEAEEIADLKKIHSAAGRLLALVNTFFSPLATSTAVSAADQGSEPAAERLHELGAQFLKQPGPREAETRPEVPGGRLLVVDDNEMNRELLRRRLEKQGHDVLLAADGAAAWELLRQQDFDLLLLDIMMPVMNGFEVLERIKLDSRLRELPVIMLSALDEMQNIVRSIELGAEDYLLKPFNSVLLRARIGACLEKKRFRDREREYLRQIDRERQRSDELLHVILPHDIVVELRETNNVMPRRYEGVAILFCDIVGFTSYCDRHAPEEVISNLQEMTEQFEEIVVKYGLEKIKTIGDSFMAAAGLLQPLADPVLQCVRSGLEMVRIAPQLSGHWSVRVGIHIGPVIAGVVGHRTYLFDVWGDTVNTAARVESHGRNGGVNVSRAVWDRVAGRCQGQLLGVVEAKGKGAMEIFVITGIV